MSDLVLKDRVMLRMLQDSADGRPSTQLSLARDLNTSRAQICNALQKLIHRGLAVKGDLLGAPPNRGTYRYRLTPAGHKRAIEMGADE